MRHDLLVLIISTSFSGQLTIRVQEDAQAPYRGHVLYSRGFRHIDWLLFADYDRERLLNEYERELYPGEKENIMAVIRNALARATPNLSDGAGVVDGVSYQLTVAQGWPVRYVTCAWHEIAPPEWNEVKRLISRWTLSMPPAMLPFLEDV